MNIAAIGCTHGNLDTLFEEVDQYEALSGKHIDLIIACGDVQTLRNETDLPFLAIPNKYKKGLCGDFHKYYKGISKASKPLIFIGGNHEASSYLRENMLGGYLAENIYFLGYSGVLDVSINDAKLRIMGVSGIFKFYDFSKGYSDVLDGSSVRVEHHVKDVDIFKLLLFDHLVKCKYMIGGDKLESFMGVEVNEEKQPEGEAGVKFPEGFFGTANTNKVAKVSLTHDWPSLIFQGPAKPNILKYKPFFEDDIYKNFIGNKGGDMLLTLTEPHVHLSGHYHFYQESHLFHNSVNKQNLLKANRMSHLNKRY